MRRAAVLVSACVAAVVPVAGADVSIDSFSQGSLNLTSSGSVVGTNESGVDTVNGNRGVLLDHEENDGGSTTATLSAGGPLMVSGTNNYLALGYGWQYSGGGFQGGPSTALHLNLSGTDAISFDFTSVNTFTDIGVLLQDDNGGSLSNENPGDIALNVSGPGIYTVPFSELDNRGMNLADVDNIEFTFQTFLNNCEFALGGVTANAVPEPAVASLAMAAFLLGGVGSRRRRKRDLMP